MTDGFDTSRHPMPTMCCSIQRFHPNANRDAVRCRMVKAVRTNNAATTYGSCIADDILSGAKEKFGCNTRAVRARTPRPHTVEQCSLIKIHTRVTLLPPVDRILILTGVHCYSQPSATHPAVAPGCANTKAPLLASCSQYPRLPTTRRRPPISLRLASPAIGRTHLAPSTCPNRRTPEYPLGNPTRSLGKQRSGQSRCLHPVVTNVRGGAHAW